jgi:hypothetical protein
MRRSAVFITALAAVRAQTESVPLFNAAAPGQTM